MTAETISEAVSKKRGRPRLWSEKTERRVCGDYPEFTHRHRQNHYYAIQPIAPWVRQFVDLDANRYRVTVLAELGRLEHPELIIEIAHQATELIEEEGYKMKELAKFVRFARKMVREEARA